jgi:hypothetical protein
MMMMHACLSSLLANLPVRKISHVHDVCTSLLCYACEAWQALHNTMDFLLIHETWWREDRRQLAAVRWQLQGNAGSYFLDNRRRSKLSKVATWKRDGVRNWSHRRAALSSELDVHLRRHIPGLCMKLADQSSSVLKRRCAFG